jgi:phospholipid-binding lipoprotein MlaA
MMSGTAYASVRRRFAAGMVWAALASLLLLQGCASGPHATARDPLEPMNRSVSKFNDAMDRAVLKPAATAYQAVTPPVVRTGVSNFFNNLSDAWSFVNTVVQLKPRESVDNFLRVAVNTFIGVGGLFDLASEMNIERHPEDFGQTLGRWGVPAGPYLVLPFLGPSTVRDTFAIGVESKADVVLNIQDVRTRNSLEVLRALETRANLLRAGNVLDEAALDKYSFLRDVYLQKRRSEIFDGNPPEEEDTTPDTTPPDPSKPEAAKPEASKPGAVQQPPAGSAPASAASAPASAASAGAKP